jgi:hypothetical protein
MHRRQAALAGTLSLSEGEGWDGVPRQFLGQLPFQQPGKEVVVVSKRPFWLENGWRI